MTITQIGSNLLIEGVDFYRIGGYKVFTKKYLLNRRINGCCKNGCRHCPWNYKYDMEEKDDLFFDMDGVIVDFDAHLVAWWPRKRDTRQLNEISLEERDAFADECQATPGFYQTMPPLKNALLAFTILSEEFNCFILSAPSWGNPHSYTEKRLWVEEHLKDLAYKKLILTHDKGLHRGRALIDDRTKYNVEKFIGEHIQFGNDKFSNWDVVVEYLAPHRFDDYLKLKAETETKAENIRKNSPYGCTMGSSCSCDANESSGCRYSR